MPSERDYRCTVRFSDEGAALVKLAAQQAGISVSGLVRECAERYALQVARDRLAGRAVHIRAANGQPRNRRRSAQKARARAAAAEREPERTPVSVPEAFRLAAEKRGGR